MFPWLNRMCVDFVAHLRASRIVFLLLSFFMGSALLWSWPPVTIAILDVPVDLRHPDIEAAIEVGFLKHSLARMQDGKTVTWQELNDEARAQFEALRDKPVFKKAIELIRLTRQEDSTVPSSAKLQELRDLYQSDAHFRAQVELASAYMHGTHVAGILLKGLQDVRLIPMPHFNQPMPPAPMLEPDSNLTNEELLAQLRETGKKNADFLLNLDVAEEAEKTRHLYESISETLKTQDVKVINASVGFSPASLVNAWQAMVMDPDLWSEVDERLIEKALRIADVQRKHFAKLVMDNPQTVFVIAAGNEGKFLGRAGVSIATKMNAPNLITVAATDHEGKLASFSNFHAGIVDIAAEGDRIRSALVGGGHILDSGTSMGAPAVSNILARIFALFPKLSPVEAITRLYQDHVVHSQALKGAVDKERLLQPNEDLLISNCAKLFR